MNKFNTDVKEVKEKTEQVYDNIKDNAEKTYDHSKNKAEELITKVKGSVSDFYNSNKEKIVQAEDYVEESIKSLNNAIIKQPLSSILIAAGIGYLFSKFKK